MLLPAGGNHGNFRVARQCRYHAVLVAFGKRQPLAIDNEMAVVEHPLRFVSPRAAL